MQSGASRVFSGWFCVCPLVLRSVFRFLNHTEMRQWSLECGADRKMVFQWKKFFPLKIFLGSVKKTTMESTNTTKGVNSDAFRNLMCVFSYWLLSVFLLKKVSVLEAQRNVALCLLSSDDRALLKYIDIFENGHIITKFLQSLPVF